MLQPLEVPSQVWADISMNFIEGLHKVGGKSAILTVVDRFSKYTHFIALGHPYTAASVARAFFDGIVRLHGFPASIVSDREPMFTGHVWRDLFKMAGVKLRFRTVFHPQTDGLSEVVNKVIAMYLRCVTGDRPRAWVDWLAWAEYCYNTFYHSALRAKPFEVVYGRLPPPILLADPAIARTEAAGELLRSRDEILAEVRQRLVQAQQIAKHYYAGHHREWTMRWETGCGCAFFIDPPSPSNHVRSASLILATLGPSSSWSAWEHLHIAFSCQRALAYMMSFMWIY
jgi:hypothetical protein